MRQRSGSVPDISPACKCRQRGRALKARRGAEFFATRCVVDRGGRVTVRAADRRRSRRLAVVDQGTRDAVTPSLGGRRDAGARRKEGAREWSTPARAVSKRVPTAEDLAPGDVMASNTWVAAGWRGQDGADVLAMQARRVWRRRFPRPVLATRINELSASVARAQRRRASLLICI